MLVLGGSAFQVPAIQRARELGHYVLTCDYLPDNPGHRHAHEYHNVSTTDLDTVLELARRREVDGVLAFASDPAASTAAYVSSHLNLPGNSIEAVHTLTNKIAFRTHLCKHGFKTPRFAAATSLAEATAAARTIGFPVMVKPCDSSGSKGVSRVDHMDGMEAAYQAAQHYSRFPNIIVERWIPRRDVQIAGDGLVLNGTLVFECFGDEHFDLHCCPHAPVGESFPGVLSDPDRAVLMSELQRLFTQLGIQNLVFNLDAMFDAEGDLVILEVGPRAGGNGLPEIIRAHSQVDLIDIAIRFALGQPVAPKAYAAKKAGFHATWMIHSRADGELTGYHVAPELKLYIQKVEFLTTPGTAIRRFASSADTLGYALLSFPSALEMQRELARIAIQLAPVLA